jgi:chromate transporter
MVAIAQSSPGPIAVNTSIMVGYRMAKVPGALCTVFGTVLPPLIIITILSFFYEAFRQNATVSAAMQGMQAGVAAVIADAAMTMIGSVAKQKSLVSWAVMLGAFAAAAVFDVNVGIIVLACAAIGVASALWGRGKRREGGGGK